MYNKMKHRDYMQIALDNAQKAFDLGEVPVGAVIVYKGEVIAQGYNQRETLNNSTLHAEIVAINKACEHLKSWRLSDCTMYVTLEPCPMCAGAIVNSRIKTVIFGAVDEKAGAFGGLFNLLDFKVNHKPEILIGIHEEKCINILKEFFERLR